MKIRILTLSLTTMFMIISSKAYLQNSNHKFSFYMGYGMGIPDKRYDFLYNQYVTEIGEIIRRRTKDATNDNGYFLGVSYGYEIVNCLKTGIGLGYAQLKQDFLLPANGNSFFGAIVEPFFWRDYSRYHMVQISPELSLDIIKYKSTSIGINTRLVSNISFRKEINYKDGTSNDLALNKTEFFATELYPGIFISLRRVSFDVSYRVLHWKYRDDAIANNGLTVDTYNPSKWRFQLSYEFWRSKKKE